MIKLAMSMTGDKIEISTMMMSLRILGNIWLTAGAFAYPQDGESVWFTTEKGREFAGEGVGEGSRTIAVRFSSVQLYDNESNAQSYLPRIFITERIIIFYGSRLPARRISSRFF